MKKRLLLTGASGALGSYLLRSLGGTYEIVKLSRQASSNDSFICVDLSDRLRIERVLDIQQPKIIVHAAAHTNVDGCEMQPRSAWRDNVESTRNIVEWIRTKQPGTKLVYVSTDQVYGKTKGPHQEEKHGPVNLYGATKLWGEDLVRALPNHLVLRLNYVGLGTRKRPGLLDWLLDHFRSGEAFTLFKDVLFNPLSGDQAAVCISNLLQMDACGVFNLGAEGDGLSKADFAMLLANNLNFSAEHARFGLLKDAKLKAPRPFDTRMDVRRASKITPLPDIDTVIRSIADDTRRAGV